jgi:hypothetical protein
LTNYQSTKDKGIKIKQKDQSSAQVVPKALNITFHPKRLDEKEKHLIKQGLSLFAATMYGQVTTQQANPYPKARSPTSQHVFGAMAGSTQHGV